MKTMQIIRILSVLLAMLLLAGTFPAVYAEEEAKNIIQEAEAGEQTGAEAVSDETTAEVSVLTEAEETTEGSRTVYRAFDVSLQKEGQELAAEGEFRVTVETGLESDSLVPEGAVCTSISYTLFHIHGDAVDVIEDAEVDENGILTFTTPNFSTFVLQYTVDFAFEAENGSVYKFSIPGGGCISICDLAQKLNLAKDDPETEADEVWEFVENIETVEFSSPELVFIGNTEADYTVGQVKEAFGLECEYSAELTEEEIEEINAQVIKAGDWAVISLQPFTSPETMTVIMKVGKVYTVQVTDMQISTDVLTAAGETYRITVTYDAEAQIPDGTILTAVEIEPGTDDYIQYLGRVWAEANKEYFEVEEMRLNYDESMGELPDVPYTNINTARFFDISLVHNGEEIEPKAPVKVEIGYTQGLKAPEGTTPGVVHYVSEDEVYIIDDVDKTVSDQEVTSFRYEQDSFSVVGTYIGQEMQDIYTEPKFAAPPDPSGKPRAKSIDLQPETLETIIRYSSDTSSLLRDGEAEQPDTEDPTDIGKPVAHKTLTPNSENGVEDGTYTLTLSVKGHSSITHETQAKKSNVLVVMDRSSSMITKTVNDEESFWYYGTWNQNEYTFRGDISPANGYQFVGVIDGEYVDLNVSQSWTSWNNYNLTYTYFNGNGWITEDYPYNYPLYVRSKTTRMVAEQEALSGLFTQLMDLNAVSGENQDVVEISVISFGDQRFDYKSWGGETEVGWQSGRDTSALMNGVGSNRFTSGTNWEEALEYAYSVISAKKEADGSDEDYYVVFLTDGEPTAVHGNNPGAVPYQGDAGNLYAYGEAKDEAKLLVDEGYKFYNIFTYRNGESAVYSIYLTNYAYGNGDTNGSTSTDAVQNYFSDAQTIDALNDAFSNIFFNIEDSIGHGNVSITDTLTTDAMTTTVVQGKTNGYVYTVTDGSGAVLYTVTSTGDIDNNPTVVFHVEGSSTPDYTASSETIEGKTVYSVRTDEGLLYKIALADINNQTGELVWDLSPVGLLMDNCTYSVSFVVWPDQEAYDYVAALNNGLPGYTWNDSAATDSGKGYKIGGVAEYPSIVKYDDGIFAVLTNTDQQLHYSVIETKTVEGEDEPEITITGPFYKDLETPDPMPLTTTKSQIEKRWNVERDPGVLAQFLYKLDGSPTEYHIGFEILQDDEEEAYKTVSIGWDDVENRYKWDSDSIRIVTYNGNPCEVGTRWSSDFSISTGLMLSGDRMDEIGLDRNAYADDTVTFGGVTYYILEDGHDYTIKEPNLTYNFDFSAPVYHPMLVDGILENVIFTRNEGGITVSEMTPIDADGDGLSSLVIENTLRGYINLNKVIVDMDGTTVIGNDDTKFTYQVELSSTTEPGPFTYEGSHIPWYGISGLFYHDAEYNYYQAEPNGPGSVKLTDENGIIYDAQSSDFAEEVGPAAVTYTDNEGNTRTIQLYGNQMVWTDDNHVSAVLKINQDQTLSIANVPVNTEYSITETPQVQGYELVNIASNQSSNDLAGISIVGNKISGKIVADADNNITYTNKRLTADISIQKLDKKGNGLAGAVFQLKKVNGDTEELATGIGGLGNVTKVIDGATETYASAFETTGTVQTLSGIPDGTYRLYEVCVPAGYMSTLNCIEFTITNSVMSMVMQDNSIQFTPASGNSLALLKVTNTAGVELPATGGTGAAVYYVIGLGIALGAGLLLAKRKKKL